MDRTKLLMAALAMGATALACGQYTSPELILVADGGGFDGHNDYQIPQIERYDPFTHQYLGSFGQSYLQDPRAIMVLGQDAYVTDVYNVSGTLYSRILKFNFSTGAFDGSIFSASTRVLSGLSTYGTNLLASDRGIDDGTGSGVFTFASNGTLGGFQGIPNGSFAEGVAADASHSYIATSGGQGLYSYNLNAQGLSTGANFNSGAGDFYFGVATLGGRIFAAGNDSSNGILVEYNSSGNQVDRYSQGPPNWGPLAFGHNGMLYVEGGANNVFLIDTGSPLFLGPLGSFYLDRTGVPKGMAVYAAPEPFSIAGLSLGVVALVRRRKKIGR